MAERQIIDLGAQKAVVSYGTHDGMPALFFLPYEHDETIGDDVPEHQREEIDRLIREEATVIRFATPEAIFKHLDGLERLVRAIAESQGVEV